MVGEVITMSERLEDSLRTGNIIAYGDTVGYVVVWSMPRTFTVYQDGKRWQTFTVDCPDGMGEAMDVAREWIMSNTFE